MSVLGPFQPRRFKALFISDAMSLTREPVLLVNLFIGLLLPVLIWVLRPQIDTYAFSITGIEGFADYLVPFALIIPAILIGWVTGMLLLEDRDDGPLLALEVTLIGKGGFLLYRSTVVFLLGVAATLFSLVIVLPGVPIQYLPIALLVGLESALVSFMLVALASNKVEGLALSKILNTMALFPLLALIPDTWRFLFSLLPSFWIGEIVFNGKGTVAPLIFLLALSVHILALWFFYKIVTKRLG